MSHRLPGDRGACPSCPRRAVRLDPDGAVMPHRYLGTPGLTQPGQPCPGAGQPPRPTEQEDTP